MALAASPLRNPQTLLPPKSLNLFVIDDPALATSIVISRAEPPPRMVPRVIAQPSCQSRFRIIGGQSVVHTAGSCDVAR